MLAKLWHYFKIFLALWILFKLFHKCEHRAWAQSTSLASSFFNGDDLDYWREGKKVKPFLPSLQDRLTPKSDPLQPPIAGSIIRQRDAFAFDWKNYEDPKSPEFWDDGGDYVAPRPLREAVANPTPENLERYAAWQAKRLIVIAQFNQKLVAQSLVSRGSRESKHNTHSPSQREAHSSAARASHTRNLREVSLLYFYQTSCPHCQAEKEKVEALKMRGINVTFIQMDADENPPLHVPSVPYSAALSKQFGVTATPTWIFRRREKSVRLQGEQSENELFSQISTLFQPTTINNSKVTSSSISISDATFQGAIP